MSALPEIAERLPPSAAQQLPFFLVPPFPGRRFDRFTRLTGEACDPASLRDCIPMVREKRVGGAFWARQPDVPPAYLLVRLAAALPHCDSLSEQHGNPLLWLEAAASESSAPSIVGECDPWHMLGNARALVCDADDPVRIVAAILGIPTYVADTSGGPPQLWSGDVERFLDEALPVDGLFSNPFDEQPLNLVRLIELCGFWRTLIDSNRSICGGVGFAFWKQDSVRPLLWGGDESSSFFRALPSEPAQGAVAIWRSKTSPGVIDQLQGQGTTLIEVEDGFLRSRGLGADCVPPLSITVDRLGPYFDPAQPSELENLLQHGAFDQPLVERARRLRGSIVAAGLGKYDQGAALLDRFEATKRHILVAGQVEDDRSILTGGYGLASNLALLQQVRARAPDAFLIYKPHPDVVAGHRKGHIPEHACRQIVDMVVTEGSISSLIAMVDEVHVNTSLAGFEALMRHKNVTTYGVPFYAGWGLTRDLGPVPVRRTTKRTLDELVAATLLLYPRYLDPVSGLPAPAEVVVDRLVRSTIEEPGPLVRLRRLQGRWKRRLTAWRGL